MIKALRVGVQIYPSTVWDKRLPTKMPFFLWRMFNRLLPFLDILSRMGFQLPSKCLNCDSVDSLFHGCVSYPYAMQLWCWAASFFQVELDFSSVHALCQSFWCYDGRFSLRLLIRIVPQIIFWILWKRQNAIIFYAVPFALARAQGLFRELVSGITFRYPLKLYGSSTIVRGTLDFVHVIHAHRSVVVTRWLLPTFPLLKLNVDGSSLGNPGHSGGGVVLRDSTGGLVLASYFGQGTSF